MEKMKNNLETLVPKVLNVAHMKGVPKMEALVNACIEEDELDEEAKLSDGKNSDLLYSLIDSLFYEDIVRYSLHQFYKCLKYTLGVYSRQAGGHF